MLLAFYFYSRMLETSNIWIYHLVFSSITFIKNIPMLKLIEIIHLFEIVESK